jgi:hypothetical protein
MAVQNLSNFHHAYSHLVRHWHVGSEQFAGGDALFTALENGWDMGETVEYEEYWSTGAARIVVCHFQLTRGKEAMTMPVITNPYIERVLSDMNVKTVRIADKKKIKRA